VRPARRRPARSSAGASPARAPPAGLVEKSEFIQKIKAKHGIKDDL
jgi:hypothetical protein